jgi:hypothetical protein
MKILCTGFPYPGAERHVDSEIREVASNLVSITISHFSVN